MIHNRLFLLTCAIGLVFSGFTSCEPENNAMSTPHKVPAMIEDDNSESRHEWKSGETIGVYMLEDQTHQLLDGSVNIPYQTMGDGHFSAVNAVQTIQLPLLGDPATFFAYYPYTQNIGNDANNPRWTIRNWDVQQDDWHKVDLLISEYVTGRNKEQSRVRFNFIHQFSMIKLNLLADEENSYLTREDLADATITISNVSKDLTCQLFDGTLIYGAITHQDIHFNVADDGHVAVVVLPPDENGIPLSDRIIRISLSNGNVYQITIDNSLVFEKGNCYVWGITLSGDTKISAELQGSITDWNDNILDDIELEADNSI